MLHVNDIINNLDQFTAGLVKRGVTNAKERLEEVLHRDEKRKGVQRELDEVLSRSNQVAKEIGKMMAIGQLAEAEAAKSETKSLKEKSKLLGIDLQQVDAELQELLYNIPNVPHNSVPEGKKEEDHELIKISTTELPVLSEGALPHWELINKYGIIDFDLGNKVTGAGFPFYKKEGARLVRAMINYFLDQAMEAGYEEVQTPILVNEDSGLGTGQLPDKEGQMYGIEKSQLYLIPTAEVPITNMYRNEIVVEDALPIKHVGYTPCFRREAGSWGAHVRGLNRLHQFDKVEIVQITKPEDSYRTLEQMVSHVEGLIKNLELPYRILKLCAGDLGFTSALTYDFEVYSAAQKKWLEVSSVSNFETYQANRLKLRYKDKDNKKHLAHTLNGSALAVPRILAAILENNQHASGIRIPSSLHRYTGFTEISR